MRNSPHNGQSAYVWTEWRLENTGLEPLPVDRLEEVVCFDIKRAKAAIITTESFLRVFFQ